ncbi:Transthyretin-like family protein [Oesophagostomum dentatum]|uniref:Transthyretin-like family protein n=1 Tax=Oesophagostomum dentatum TaxID=61180 RepID=A0A0B1SI79_OESDE|nr:Transthyretin-like family protein [Oesophagostomum dentatum]
MKLLLLAVLPALVSTLPQILPTLGTLQSTAVQGKLLCNGKPYEKARLKLYEVDPIHDTLMAEMLSDKDGFFKLSGNDTEWSKIDPKLNIYHNCEDEKVECWRKVEIKIPKDFITEGGEPDKTFDIGTLNLNAKLPGETRDCLN